MENFYKIFFTIYFDNAERHNKTITKFFKSDVDLGPSDFLEKMSDKNIFKPWKKHSNEQPLNNLKPEKNFIEKKAKNKKVVTHRIVNLKTLSGVFLR